MRQMRSWTGRRRSSTPMQPYLKHALAMVRGELALGRGELRRAVTILEPLSRAVDEVSGRIFKRVVRGALARAQVADGELVAALGSLAPLVAGWHVDDEGPFMHSALSATGPRRVGLRRRRCRSSTTLEQ